MKLDCTSRYSQSGGGFGDGGVGLMQMECISGCRQPPGGGCLHKKPETRQEIRMKVADEEEEGGRREEKKTRQGGAGVDESVNWDCSEEGGVNTITLHVTEHTVTVRLEARYRPSSP